MRRNDSDATLNVAPVQGSKTLADSDTHREASPRGVLSAKLPRKPAEPQPSLLFNYEEGLRDPPTRSRESETAALWDDLEFFHKTDKRFSYVSLARMNGLK